MKEKKSILRQRFSPRQLSYMQKIELSIAALANSEPQSNNFIVILKENEGDRRLPVVIGGFEAQAIAIAIEKIKPNRPLTHDLFKNVLIELKVELREVIISDLKNGVFYAKLVCAKEDGWIHGAGTFANGRLFILQRMNAIAGLVHRTMFA